jgi:hypothetical protein
MHQGEEVGPGTWPAITDAGVWAEVRARREFRSAAHKEALSKPRQRYYLLRGLVLWGRCGTLAFYDIHFRCETLKQTNSMELAACAANAVTSTAMFHRTPK